VALQDLVSLCERLRAPAEYRDLARLTASVTTRLGADLGSNSADTLLTLFEQSDAFRRRERFEKVLIAAQARMNVDPGIRTALSAATEVTLSSAQMKTLKGFEIAALLHDARLQRLRNL
jgi:tRNA nucleotidyltransferase (CCA-adding enzyme)